MENLYDLIVHEQLLSTYIEFALNDDLQGCFLTAELAIRAYQNRITKLNRALINIRRWQRSRNEFKMPNL